MAEVCRSDLSSDATFDFLCTPCSEDENNSEAVNYCTDCQSYFCLQCIKFHNRIPGMRGHDVLGKDEMKKGVTTKPQLPTEKCAKHEGKIVDMYCQDEDLVGCAVCFALEHRSCTQLFYIPDVSEDFQNSKQYNETNQTITRVKANIAGLKNSRIDTRERFDEEKDLALKTIRTNREKVNIILDNVEEKSKTETITRHTELRTKVTTDISVCDKAIGVMENLQTDLDISKAVNNSQLFVKAKLANRIALGYDKQYNDICTNGTEEEHIKLIELYEDLRIEMCVKDIGTFGHLDLRSKTHVYSAAHYGDYNVKDASDNNVCSTYGTCQLRDGTWLLTDWNNNKLKRLDSTFQMTDALVLSDSPWGVCCTRNNEVAVTLTTSKLVQFVSCGVRMKQTRSFSTISYCHGIICIDDKLYITHQHSSIIWVHHMLGKHLHTINKDKSGLLCPWNITFSSKTNYLYVADNNNGLVVMDTQGNMKFTKTSEELQKACGICLDDTGCVFVCGHGSNNVLQADIQGGPLKVFLKQSDGINSPHTVCFDRNQLLLMVTLDNSNTIKVFKLNGV